MKKLNLLIIGTGKMGETHLSLYIKNNKKLNIFVYDKNSNLCQKIADKYNVTCLSDFNEVKNKNIDICDICLPNHLHFDYIKQAIKLNTHIIVEKPVVMSSKEWQLLSNNLNNYKKVFMCAYVERYFQPYLLVKKFLEENNAKIINFSFTRWGNNLESGSWLSDISKSGGVLMDLGIHDVDFLCSIIDPINKIDLLSFNKKDQCSELLLKINNSIIGSISSGWNILKNEVNNFYNSFIILTNKGILKYDSITKDLYINGKKNNIKKDRYPDAYSKELKVFIQKTFSRKINNKNELNIITKTMFLLKKIKQYE